MSEIKIEANAANELNTGRKPSTGWGSVQRLAEDIGNGIARLATTEATEKHMSTAWMSRYVMEGILRTSEACLGNEDFVTLKLATMLARVDMHLMAVETDRAKNTEREENWKRMNTPKPE